MEGVADKKFLKDFCKFLKLGIADENFFVIDTNVVSGKDDIKVRVKQDKEAEIETYFIIDANSSREKFLETLADSGIQKENIFTFPDNKSNGNLEDLIRKICVDKNNFFECMDDFNKCISDKKLKLIDPKAEIYAYDYAVGGEGKEEYRKYYDSKNYDLNHPALNPLKKFLQSRFS